MSRRANDDEQHDIKPFDCVTSGQAYRDFKNAALRHLAGTVDTDDSIKAAELGMERTAKRTRTARGEDRRDHSEAMLFSVSTRLYSGKQ